MTRFVLVVEDDGGDYYVGESAALYRDGVLVWSGYSADAAAPILRAALGDEVEVRSGRRPDLSSGWPARLHGAPIERVSLEGFTVTRELWEGGGR